jgi:DNA-directed RNA polymerase sigma subunit (sigma70/sigma32)
MKDLEEKLMELSKLLSDINSEIEELESRRAYLLNLRENALKNAHEIIGELTEEYDERCILYRMVDEHDRSLESISEALNLREKVVRDIFKRLSRLKLITENNLAL